MVEDKKSQEELKLELKAEWNRLVKGFSDAQRAWERLKELLFKSNIFEELDLVLQRRLNQVCKTTKFSYAASSFIDLLSIRGNVEDLLIKSNDKKEKDNEG